MKTNKKTIGILSFIFLVVPTVGLAETWSVPGDFSTIQKAVNSSNVVDGDEIEVGPGYFKGARITKSLVLRGSGRTYITDGPKPWKGRPFNAGFMFRGPRAENGSGTKIYNFVFKGVDFPIFASQRGAVVANVTVEDCTMKNPIQGITMWHADSWVVQFNRIVDLRAKGGGGVGILVGSYAGDDAYESVIEENEIVGTVHVDADDKGGYNAAGIFIVSDHREGSKGGLVEGNLVRWNKISLKSDRPDVVPVYAVDLSDTRGWVKKTQVQENQVSDNDLDGTSDDVNLVPLKLDDVNDVQ